MTLSHNQAKIFYDKFGQRQDYQFYEAQAIQQLLQCADFETADSIFEFGCGTGKFAQKLFSDFVPDSTTYTGLDISNTMVLLTQQRLQNFGIRAKVNISDGKPALREESESYDRFVSNYVLDLLDTIEIEAVLSEAYRILKPEGRVCLISLTHGDSAIARMIEYVWTSLYRLKPSLVGGCRPLRLDAYVRAPNWRIECRQLVRSFGITSEVMVAKKQ